MKHLDITIYGEVQGVSFRYYAKQKADELNLFGFIRNQLDGSVFAEVEGEAKALDSFVDWIRTGPAHSKVDRIEIGEGMMKNYTAFEIRL
ncbi:MAG: acylphosphatase [Candidatus Doudnabacteria bacterium]|nr:acylphosphatase [Candidatus Doudnabacteria bacterium]